MTLTMTSMFAAILGLFVFVLAFITVMQRVRAGHSWGHGDDAPLMRAIRAHAHLVEYAPMFLILLGLMEHRGASSTWLWSLGGVFIASRALYALYFLVRQSMALRVIGFWSSAAPILIASIWLLVMR